MMLTTSRVSRKTNHGAEKMRKKPSRSVMSTSPTPIVASYVAWIWAICAAYALGSCRAKAGTCFMTAPITPATARTLIWRTANLTLVSVRHTARPRRPNGLSCVSARRSPRVMVAK